MTMTTGRLHVGRGRTVGAITLFPVWSERAGLRPRQYITVSDAVSYSELATRPEVPQLHVANGATSPVLVMDGQLFEGGWQDRMATRSYIVGAGREELIDVACVERDRWAGEAKQKTWYRRSPASVRAGADAGGQEEVWRRIDARSSRGSGRSLVELVAAAGEQAGLMQRYARLIAGQAGVMIGIGGVPVSLELFDSPATLREQMGHILRAAALDALGSPALPTPDRLAVQAAGVIERTTLDQEPRVGQLARLGRGASRGFDVMELDYKLTCVHLRATNVEHPTVQAA